MKRWPAKGADPCELPGATCAEAPSSVSTVATEMLLRRGKECSPEMAQRSARPVMRLRHASRRTGRSSSACGAQKTVKAFLFAGHVPPGTRLTVTGLGRAHDSAGPARDRRSTIAYQRFTITINR